MRTYEREWMESNLETVVHPVCTVNGLRDCVSHYPEAVCFCGYSKINWLISENHLIA
jgi:hypothetical protein